MEKVKANEPDRNPIQVQPITHKIITREAQHQTWESGFSVSMGGVIDKYASKLNKKHKLVPKGGE